MTGNWHIWEPHAVFEFAAFSCQVSLLSPLQTPPMTLSRSAPLRHISRASSAAVCIASSADTRQRRRGRSIIYVSIGCRLRWKQACIDTGISVRDNWLWQSNPSLARRRSPNVIQLLTDSEGSTTADSSVWPEATAWWRSSVDSEASLLLFAGKWVLGCFFVVGKHSRLTHHQTAAS